jgi:hypothetical protein
MPPKKRARIAKKPAETITLSAGGVSEVSEARCMKITFNEADMPVVEFLGEPWTGKDIRLCMAAVPRAYRFHKLTKRRQGVTR